MLVRQLHFRGDKGKRLGVIELHSSFQTKSWYHNAQAAALHHARDVAALYTPVTHVTLSGCRGDVSEGSRFAREKAESVSAKTRELKHKSKRRLFASSRESRTGDLKPGQCI